MGFVRPASTFGMGFKLMDESFHPPALDAGDDEEEEIPWVLLEEEAYVADRRNATTAYSDCWWGGTIQASLFVARPPRLSYICVFYRRRPAAAGEEPQADEEEREEQEQIFPIEPDVIATDENLVLLRIAVGDLDNGVDWYVYQPGGDGGPLLTRLERPPDDDDAAFHPPWFGLVSCHDRLELPAGGGQDDKFYMVAALCHERPTVAKGRFIIHLYNSKIQTWTTTKVSVEEQQYQRYQDHGYFIHLNSKVIVVGGEDATIAFVDLRRGILLCDLAHIKEKPWLRYVPLPHRELTASFKGEACLSRDIAVVNGEFKYVKQLLRKKPCPFSRCHDIRIGWVCKMFTRPVFATSALDDSWEPVCSTESSKMDIESSPDFHLLPRLEDDEGRPLPPFKGIQVSQPILGLDSDNTVCLMVNNDGKAWAMDVDLKNNRLRGVNEFDFTRYARVDIAYKQSRISRYLKNAQGTKEKSETKRDVAAARIVQQEGTMVGGEAETGGGGGMNEDGEDMLLEQRGYPGGRS